MRIESVKQAKRGKNLIVTFDDETTLRLPAAIVADFGLYPDTEITEEELAKVRREAERAAARASAVRIVSATSVTEGGLRRKLMQKGRSAEDAAEAVQWMKGLQLLDDRQVAEQVVSSCVRRGYGKARIKQALYEKQVPREYWDEALAAVPEMTDAIEDFLKKRFGGQQPDRKEIDKAVNALLRRGHSWSEIKQGLRRYEEFCADSLEDDGFYEL